jgi:poly-beta-1,6-N-acetyl-D-glucosamine synthase
MKALFWICAVSAFHAYIGYPLVLFLLKLLIKRPARKSPIEPFLSAIIPAYNESRVIEAKLRNIAALDYPIDRLEMIFASDGSRDDTVEVARGIFQ